MLRNAKYQTKADLATLVRRRAEAVEDVRKQQIVLTDAERYVEIIDMKLADLLVGANLYGFVEVDADLLQESLDMEP